MHRPSLALLSAVPVAAATLCSTVGSTLLAVAAAPAAQAKGCQAPMQGRYAVMGMGTVAANKAGSATPTARVLEERWLPNGVVQGTMEERLGRQLRSSSYSGSVKMVGTCLVQVERQLPWGRDRSEAVLDGRGRPLYSLNRSPGSVITSRWLPMAPGSCQANQLNGVVLSSQVGVNAVGSGWSPNAVVQREQWLDGRVKGVALSSYGGIGDTVTYNGTLQLDRDSCWGRLQELDSKGQAYNYRALVVNGRQGARGYIYLQSDPSDLTVGWLVRD